MKIYNTLSRETEDLVPSEGRRLGIYVCGVTPYSESHLGHGLSAVVFDVIVRYLRDRFGDERVTYVVNFTDIDDKILAASREEGVDWRELGQRYIEHYHHLMDLLNVAPADEYPLASEHVPEMLSMIERLFDRELAYVVEGDGVYYRVRGFEGYGKLSGRSLADLAKEGRVERDERFDHPADFCLWKFWDHPDAWESPWGKGRPGWHIECSAMAEKHLGLPVDIHGGGMDLKFPHHENEIAQAEGAGAERFARYWMHNGLLNLGDVKISKSVGNVLSIEEMVGKHGAGGVRHYFLGHAYRSPLKFDEELLASGATAWARIVEARERVREIVARSPQPVGMAAHVTEVQNTVQEARMAYSKAMEDDFNTAAALAAVHDMVRGLNRSAGWLGDNGPTPQLQEAFEGAGHVLDRILKVLGFVRKDGAYLGLPEAPSTDQEVGALVELLVELRAAARERKDFETGDRIRDRLAELGFELKDGPDGTTWKRR